MNTDTTNLKNKSKINNAKTKNKTPKGYTLKYDVGQISTWGINLLIKVLNFDILTTKIVRLWNANNKLKRSFKNHQYLPGNW